MRGNAVVSGAGIAGLSAAGMLVSRGWRVRVFDRADQPPYAGSLLGLWPSARRALARLGIEEQVQAVSLPAGAGEVCRADGRLLLRLRAANGVRLIPRPELIAILAARVPAQTLSWRRAVRGIDDLGVPADVIIAADGINSPLRHQILGPASNARGLGNVAFRGWASGATDGLREFWGRGALFGITPRDEDSTNFFASVRSDQAAELSDVEDLRRYFARWDPLIGQVLSRAEPQALLRNELREVPRLRRYVGANVALVGDAAHGMAPNLGHGACESIVDAVTLAEQLCRADSVGHALARYDRRRRCRVEPIRLGSAVVSRVATTPFATPARDAGLWLAGLPTRLLPVSRPGR